LQHHQQAKAKSEGELLSDRKDWQLKEPAMSPKGFRQGSPRIIGLQYRNRAGGVFPPSDRPRDPKK
jgi:hypothetical protein